MKTALAKLKPQYIWLLLAALFCFLALNRHSRAKVYTYSSMIMSDKAGYYVYMPATFLYHWKASEFPEHTDVLTGNGFILDSLHNKVLTKYPLGVALLQTPFFLAAHLLVKIQGAPADGFQKTYQDFMDLAAVFYFLAGAWLLRRFLLRHYPQKIVDTTLILFTLGTNLFFYVVFEGAYSHVFSWFLFSAWLYVYQTFEDKGTLAWLLPVLAILVVLVRPLNAIFLLITTLGLFSAKPWRHTLNLKKLLPGILPAFLLLALQLAYYMYVSGKPLMYSYGNESFIYWNKPKVFEVLLGFENGWLSTNPVHFFTLAGIAWLIGTKQKGGITLLLILAVCTYMYGSWWAYKLGCAYGHRGFTDLLPMLSIGLAALLQWAENKPSIKKILLGTMIVLCAINLKFIYTYDSCWPSDNKRSDFEIYWHFITSQPK